jgi:hypothetical protein
MSVYVSQSFCASSQAFTSGGVSCERGSGWWPKAIARAAARAGGAASLACSAG